MPSITLLCAGLLGLMSIVLAFSPGNLRGETGISVGDGGNPELLLAMRRHGNFTEFVPMALILMGLLEMHSVSTTAIWSFGGVLVLARICHPLGLKSDTINTPMRAVGAGGTALVTVVMSIWALVTFFSAA